MSFNLSSLASALRPVAGSRSSVPLARMFSTTSPCGKLYAHVTQRRVKQVKPLEAGDPEYLLPQSLPEFPPYPYGEATLYKQSNRGLYGGKMIQFGNKISEFKNRNGRTFKPNVNRQTLWSEALKRKINLRVATSVLKAINREGGLDKYLTKDTSARIKQLGPTGWKLRYLVLQKMEAQGAAKPKAVVDWVSNGTEYVPVFAKYTTESGKTLSIVRGKKKLLGELFKLKEAQFEGDRFSFLGEYKEKSVEALVRELETAGYDLKTLAL
ncbi:large ribosomal subunit protein bL28m [Trichomonascus vanleenenianus]|uniref:mitochondrial 54S ribosomal protein bL28m MRPL24 n=1 Tax=Trichomonascus vanleenenianus TaxID=2268995 RepID=UPI003ECA254F